MLLIFFVTRKCSRVNSTEKFKYLVENVFLSLTDFIFLQLCFTINEKCVPLIGNSLASFNRLAFRSICFSPVGNQRTTAKRKNCYNFSPLLKGKKTLYGIIQLKSVTTEQEFSKMSQKLPSINCSLLIHEQVNKFDLRLLNLME